VIYLPSDVVVTNNGENSIEIPWFDVLAGIDCRPESFICPGGGGQAVAKIHPSRAVEAYDRITLWIELSGVNASVSTTGDVDA
jgi:hypothetical protein